MSRPLKPFSATVLGLPRIGPNRELERAAEAYWAGRVHAAALHRTAAELRTAQLRAAHDAGTDSVPVGTFSYYDHVLDTAVLLGALPERVHGIDDELDRCCATARGTKVVPAERLWVNPDCGLETRGAEEVLASLRNLVAAAAVVRRSCA
ncbi:hypothetical protein [Nocardia farcinica]|uniref:hypothetical protein n=1 Tax=Nocardia farcinica TaxID=37329 RepID=UPI002456972B|nr:hypothetical protein [Nocardia farcinica]